MKEYIGKAFKHLTEAAATSGTGFCAYYAPELFAFNGNDMGRTAMVIGATAFTLIMIGVSECVLYSKKEYSGY